MKAESLCLRSIFKNTKKIYCSALNTLGIASVNQLFPVLSGTKKTIVPYLCSDKKTV